MELLPSQWLDFVSDLAGRVPALPTLPTAAWVGFALLIAVWLGERLQRAGMARTMGYWLCGAGFGIALVWAQVWMGQPVLATVASGAANAGAANSASTLGEGGPSSWATLRSLSWIFDLALGWVLVELGQRIDLRWLLRNKALAATAVLEYALTWALAALALRSLGLAWLPAGVAATLAAHSSPVMLSTLLPQWRAEGQVTERALHLGSINTVLTAITLPLVLSLVGAYAQGEEALFNPGVLGSAQNSVGVLASGSVLRSGLELAQPLWEAAASMAIGFALGWLLSRLRSGALRRVGAVNAVNPPGAQPDRAPWLSMLGAVCIAVGLAQWLTAPALVACLALGLSMRRRAALAHMGDNSGVGVGLSQLAQVLMFLVAGASLPWLQWVGLQPEQAGPALDIQVLVLAALLLLIRVCAKVFVCTLTARWAGLRWVQGLALGLMLQPLSMTGLVFWAMAASALATPYAQLSHAVLLMLCISDVLAPWMMRAVLRAMREVEPGPAPPALAPTDYSGLQTQSSVNTLQVDTHAELLADIRGDRRDLRAMG
jgi:Kef-type K+ transport system membrane component KefB